MIPADFQYQRPATSYQLDYLQRVRDSGMLTQREFGRMNRAILEAYGYAGFEVNEGTAFVLCDYWKNARPKHKRELERRVKE